MMCLKSNSPKRLSTIVEPACSAMTLASDVRSLTGVRRCATVWAGIVSVFGVCKLVSAVRIDRRNEVYRPCSSLLSFLLSVAFSPPSADVSRVLSSDLTPAASHTIPLAVNQLRLATVRIMIMRSNTFFITANIKTCAQICNFLCKQICHLAYGVVTQKGAEAFDSRPTKGSYSPK